jgi:hypothetical protein
MKESLQEAAVTETKFAAWVKEFGVSKLAEEMRKLGQDYALTYVAIYQHLRAETEPRPTKMRGYVKIAGGRITLQDIHDHIEVMRAARANVQLQEARP